ncbi:MAG: MATE family efflux transporter, partial [Synergistales bacterium]|nr:MATE family efflux transporter [Synergistales bacterium]
MSPLKSDYLTDRPVGELLFRLSLPSIIGLVLQMAYSLTDTFFVALWIGDKAVAALAVAFPIQLVMVAFAQGFGIGGATLIGRYLGSRDTDNSDLALKNTLILTGATSLGLPALALYFLHPIVHFLGASPQSMPMAISYSSVVLLGSPFLSFSIATNAIARAEGRASVAMKTLAISSLVNAVLDPIFIKTMGMGVSGAAWATVISQAGSA